MANDNFKTISELASLNADGIINLCAAVVDRAFEDMLGTTQDARLNKADALMFWSSEWCDLLTLGVDKKYLIDEAIRVRQERKRAYA